KYNMMVYFELYRKTEQTRADAEALRELQAREHQRELADAMEQLASEARQVERLVEAQRRALQLQKLTPASLVIHSARKVDGVLRAAAAQARIILEADRARVGMSVEGAPHRTGRTLVAAEPPDDPAAASGEAFDEELCNRIAGPG